MLLQPVLDHWLPGHQAEPHAIIQHDEASAGEHEAAAVDTADSFAIGRWTVGQAALWRPIVTLNCNGHVLNLKASYIPAISVE